MISVERRKKRAAVLSFVQRQINQNISYFIPEDFSREEILEGIPEGLNKNKAKSILYYIANAIAWENREIHRYTSYLFEFCGFHSSNLSNLFGSSYSKYLLFFVSKHILVRCSYKPGVNSFQYNIHPRYQKSNFIYCEIADDPFLKNKKKWLYERLELLKPFYEDYADTLYWFTTGKLNIKRDEASAYLENYKKKNISALVNTLIIKKSTGEINAGPFVQSIKNKIPTQISRGLKNINDINLNKAAISIDRKGWRLYSSVTMMMSPLRNFLTYDEEELVAVDIKNSQPFHFCYVLSKSFWADQALKCSFQTLCNTTENEAGQNLFFYFKERKELFKKIRAIVSDHPSDIATYVELNKKGIFYEYLSKEFKPKYPHFHSSRKASKLRFVIFLNFDNEKQNTPFYSDYRHFKKLFPNVAFVIEALKHRDYKDISKILQRLEAKMLLYYFVREFSNKYPSVPIITVHDSIITLKSHKKPAIEILNKVYERTFGVYPQTDGGVDLNSQNAEKILSDYINDKAPDDFKVDFFLTGRRLALSTFDPLLFPFA